MSKSEKPRIQPGSEGWSTKVSGGKGMSILLQVKPSSEDKYRRLLVQSVKITWKKEMKTNSEIFHFLFHNDFSNIKMIVSKVSDI